MDYTVWNIDSAPGDSKKGLEAAKKKFGFVPNLLGILAEAPAALDTYMAVSSAFEKTSLTAIEQQVVLLSASVENRCHYCVAAHTTVAKMLGASAELVRNLREEDELRDPRLRALSHFTRRVVATRGFVHDEDTKAFLDAGFDKSQLLEVLVGITQKTLSNYTNHIAHTPVDAAFESNAWTPLRKSEVEA